MIAISNAIASYIAHDLVGDRRLSAEFRVRLSVIGLDLFAQSLAGAKRAAPMDAPADRQVGNALRIGLDRRVEGEPTRPEMPAGGLFSPAFIDWYIGK
jgi:hypothetical protein